MRERMEILTKQDTARNINLEGYRAFIIGRGIGPSSIRVFLHLDLAKIDTLAGLYQPGTKLSIIQGYWHSLVQS